MNVVDSCGWLEYFADGVNASFFASPIEDNRNLLVPVICVYEVFKSIYRQRGEDAALQGVAQMYRGEIIPVDDSCALYTAKYSIDHRMPMADSIILAVARMKKATLWTQDDDFRNISGVKYIMAKIRS